MPSRAADPSNLSEASQLSAQGSATIARGSLTAVVGSAEFVVASVELVGDGLQVVLKGSAELGEVVLRLPQTLIGGASLAVGETVTVLAKATGWAIESAGRLLAFVPTEAGRALLHTQRVSRGAR